MRSTSQRRLVLELVRESKVHPTADQVFEMARGKHPTIGRATVYRNLAVLADAGQLRRVTLPGQPERYDDPRVLHGHFYCRRCGVIHDLPLPATLPDRIGLPGHRTEECQVTLCGLCPKCQEESV